MKIGLILGALMPLVLLPACGGDTPNNPDPAGGSGGSSSGGSTPANSETPKPTPSTGGSAANQDPKPKRIRRPKINKVLLTTFFKNDPPAPPSPVKSTPELVALGNALYHSAHLSKKGNISCASCHDLSTYGVDNKATSPGTDGKNGDRNTPTTYNSGRNFIQFWDGRATSVEEQAIMPVLNPIEHGLGDEAEVVAKIKEKADLVEGFKKAFPGDADPVTAKNFGIAVGAFERTLVTRSKWDDYIEGKDKRALSNLEMLGLKTFMDLTCTQCHMTRLLGGQQLQKLGVLKPYKGEDTGRMKVTGDVAHKHMFKVPSLLNVEKTAPYYHDGSIATLEEAVNDMAQLQLGKTLNPEQTEAIVAFLKTLTGKLPEEFAK